MNGINILIAEDENDLRSLLTAQLSDEGYTIFEAADGITALEIFKNEDIHIGLFDIMMPKLNGISLMSKIRESSDIPIIFLTARCDEVDKVSGLSLGADDYIVKPFGMAELTARIAVQARKIKVTSNCSNNAINICGKLKHDKIGGCIFNGNELLRLNNKEYLLLSYLMENQGKMLTKKQMYHAVWHDEFIYDSNTIMVHISHLRNKIEDNPKQPRYLTTFKGIGYKLSAPTI